SETRRPLALARLSTPGGGVSCAGTLAANVPATTNPKFHFQRVFITALTYCISPILKGSTPTRPGVFMRLNSVDGVDFRNFCGVLVIRAPGIGKCSINYRLLC